MRKITSLFLLLFFTGFGVFAQNSPGPSEMNKLFSKNLKYSTEARQNDQTGIVTLSVAIDDAGYPVGDPKVYTGETLLAEEVLRTYEKVKESWDPSYLDGKKTGEDYLMTFEFILQKGTEFISNPMTKYKKEEVVDPLKALNKAIEENPYSSKLYKKRSEYYSIIGENWLSKLDANQSEFLKKNEITNVVIVGYGSSGKPTSL